MIKCFQVKEAIFQGQEHMNQKFSKKRHLNIGKILLHIIYSFGVKHKDLGDKSNPGPGSYNLNHTKNNKSAIGFGTSKRGDILQNNKIN